MLAIRPRQHGFGLLEVLIAAAVLLTGILATVALQTQLLRNSSDARDRTAAVHLAQGVLETSRHSAQTLSGYRALAPTTEMVMLERGAFTVSVAVVGFMLSSTGVAVGSGSATIPDVQRLTVTVSWQDATGATQSVQLESLIAAADAALGGRAAARL